MRFYEQVWSVWYLRYSKKLTYNKFEVFDFWNLEKILKIRLKRQKRVHFTKMLFSLRRNKTSSVKSRIFKYFESVHEVYRKFSRGIWKKFQLKTWGRHTAQVRLEYSDKKFMFWVENFCTNASGKYSVYFMNTFKAFGRSTSYISLRR